MLIVFTTVASLKEGEDLAVKIVEAKLAACVQILPQMRSIYVWEGKIQNEPEHLLLIKTLPEKYPELEEFIRSVHSYSVPEIAAVSAEQFSEEYSAWIGEWINS